MFPVLYQIGPISLHMYGLSIAVGFLLILWFMQRDAAKLGISADAISEMAFGVLFWGVVGTRLLHIIMYSENYSWNDPVGWVNIMNGGLVFQGAIPTGLVYAWLALRKRNIPFWVMPNIVMPYIPIAQAFGRMGCFFNGCCHGVPTSVAWGLSFPPGSPAAGRYPAADGAGWSVHVHPTQLYSVVLLLAMAGLMLYMRGHWKPFEGYMFPVYFIFYGIVRFTVECFRGDGNPTELGFGLLSNQQVFCVFFVILGGAAFAYLKKHPPRVTLPIPAAKKA